MPRDLREVGEAGNKLIEQYGGMRKCDGWHERTIADDVLDLIK